MRFLDFFIRRKPAILNLPQLAIFIDEQAAFLVQKGIYDYSRARSGHFAKVMLADPGFQAALDKSRWNAFPLGLAMVGEVVEATLAPHSLSDRRSVLDPLIELVLSVLDRYPRPISFRADEWHAARSELSLHLQRLTTHPPKRIIDIPVPFADRYFSLMPFDKPLLTPDAPTALGFMQLQLIKVHEELIKRSNLPEIVRQLHSVDLK